MTVMLANIITSSRILAAALMLPAEPFSPAFWILYAWCGISDMIDGAIARKAGSANGFGAKLDSTADFAFVITCAIKLIPGFDFDTWLLVWIVLIALCKLANIVSSLIMLGRIETPHTTANKAAGLLIFASIPIMVMASSNLAAVPACALATFAAVQEGHFIRTGKIK